MNRLGASLAPAGLLALLCASVGCGDNGRDARSTPDTSSFDPRVAQIRHWTSFRTRSGPGGGSGGLFFLSRFEFRERDVPRELTEEALGSEEAEPGLPLARVSLTSAMRIARAFWGRLPTLEEWRGAIEGRVGYLFPWGDTATDELRANTARIGLWRRTRVGTFESGRNLGRVDSCYDLIGNVSEWTITPSAIVRLDEISRAVVPTDEVADRADAFVLLRGAWPESVPFLVGPASPWMPELLLAPSGFPSRVDFCTIGFSCGQSIPPRASRVQWQDRLGLRSHLPEEWSWDLGFRMATDPYCFLGGLERAEGSPTEAEAAEIRRFLRTELEAFRSAARLRLRRLEWSERSITSSRPSIGAWGQLAYEVLAVSPR
ncbi:MAG: SUMF1/EgtB/PvdO family nonheme iron enzyme [Planctomycetes bacterium]|nr:SUMF1/EgtB/PvdO family nonheme iron enzyme [Planctomycetota bacterium]